MLDTKVGSEKKVDPAEVAKQGFDAMMAGDGDVVTGWQNKLQAAISHILPAGVAPNGTGKWLRRGEPKNNGLVDGLLHGGSSWLIAHFNNNERPHCKRPLAQVRPVARGDQLREVSTGSPDSRVIPVGDERLLPQHLLSRSPSHRPATSAVKITQTVYRRSGA